ncbi:glycerate kinase [Streptoalloteichus tenebrarius]|uniref:Glycerate kinase n=1 Tax=Streptoalloteichus tenebrarius (strain ATCC 17920 / DSM 40477 / JCM 4838 / CBS 697.72 / NBRC 16177 / NCIMB 11028 / NRRL B-12390 / A12253. 1 / ISP 5477) TaxID=1933 RepID=A0ABT1HRQ0_STRSD|nr:glycerate kinase [Streptoalloteichus tenebrarius]MCP2258196.1 glycerate kinase [Streptoalloteichus tenebrarius]BFF04575.1 glycerate kinase [Streptoalloteichus tenebrarius]
MNHVVVAPDKFKGSLTAREVATHLAAGIAEVAPDVEVRLAPIADGGDGTLEAALSAGFRRVPVRAAGPTGRPLDTAYAERDGTAVVELADASGLRRLPDGPAPLTASSQGTGEVIRAALTAGCHTVVLGLGGSAGTDGGAGMVRALGARLVDEAGRPVGPGGAALARAAELDLSGLHPAVASTRFVLATDVDNPLLGPTGAAAVYGPQKGAAPADVAVLEAGLRRWAELVTRVVGRDLTGAPGAGAAGGVGFGALAVLGAEPRSGVEFLLDLLDVRTALSGARLAVTGEGSLDAQTLRGKAPAGLAAAARALGVPVVAVAGQVSVDRAVLRGAGVERAYPLTDLEPDLARCITQAGPLLRRLGARVAREWLL